MQLSHNAEQVTVVAEDDYGNIIKKKMKVVDLAHGIDSLKGIKNTEVSSPSRKQAGEKIATLDNSSKLAEKGGETPAKDKALVETVGDATRTATEIPASKMGTQNSLNSDGENKITGEKHNIRDRIPHSETKDEIKCANGTTAARVTLTSTSISSGVGEDIVFPLQKSILTTNRNSSDLSAAGDGSVTFSSEHLKKDASAKEYQDANHNHSCDQKQKIKNSTHENNEDYMDVKHERAETTHDVHGSKSVNVISGTSRESNDIFLQADTKCRDSDTNLRSSSKVDSPQDGDSVGINTKKTVITDSMEFENSAENMSSNGVEVITAGDDLASEVSGTDEDVMKNSSESHDSEGMIGTANGIGDEEETVNQVDNFSKNEQHNMALQQTVESNQGSVNDEMVESFHLENGNVNL